MYLESIGIHEDIFLDDLTKCQRIRIVRAFALAMREARFSRPTHETLVVGTIRGTISHVVQTFRDHDRPNPTKDEDGDLGRVLSRLFRAYQNKDPKQQQQKALPVGVLRELAKVKATETQRAISQLTIAAYFFACRSCEYLKVQQSEKRRTDILRLRCIRFFKDGKELAHNDRLLEYADSVSVTFEYQKNDEKHDTVTQMATNDAVINPVRMWAAVVKRIWKYPGASWDTPVSAIWRYDRIEHLTSKEVVDALRAAVVAIGEDALGIKRNEIGTHSLRSGAAMAMYLGECPVYVIMMIGRWSSDAFLRYIRKQVEQFSHNVSCRMLRFELHRHVTDYEPRTSRLDPRQRNHPDNEETRRNIGGSLSNRVRLPAFSLFS